MYRAVDHWSGYLGALGLEANGGGPGGGAGPGEPGETGGQPDIGPGRGAFGGPETETEYGQIEGVREHQRQEREEAQREFDRAMAESEREIARESERARSMQKRDEEAREREKEPGAFTFRSFSFPPNIIPSFRVTREGQIEAQVFGIGFNINREGLTIGGTVPGGPEMPGGFETGDTRGGVDRTTPFGTDGAADSGGAGAASRLLPSVRRSGNVVGLHLPWLLLGGGVLGVVLLARR